MRMDPTGLLMWVFTILICFYRILIWNYLSLIQTNRTPWLPAQYLNLKPNLLLWLVSVHTIICLLKMWVNYCIPFPLFIHFFFMIQIHLTFPHFNLTICTIHDREQIVKVQEAQVWNIVFTHFPFLSLYLLTALIRDTGLRNSVSAGHYGHLIKNNLTPFIVFIIFFFYPFTHPLIRGTVTRNST